MRLVIVVYAGEYREAWPLLAAGRDSNWHGHKPVLDYLGRLADRGFEIIIYTCRSPEAYDEVLRPNLRVIGTGFQKPEGRYHEILEQISELEPTHLIIRTSERRLFGWAIKNRLPTLAWLADSYQSNRFKTKVRNFLLARRLNDPAITWVSNHGINACQSLQKIGVRSSKIVPWDWDHKWAGLPSKTLRTPTTAEPFTVAYVGSVVVHKGVGDVLDAIHKLKTQGVYCQLKIAGKGDVPHFKRQAGTLGIEDRVHFAGTIEYGQVIIFMRNADLVLVPSRHEYPEGLPGTVYEALNSRTPLITSDHPMFANRVEHGVNAMTFAARDSEQLAAHIRRLMDDPELYAALSAAGEEAWQRLQLPAKWDQIVDRWLSGDSSDHAWLKKNSLSSGIYDDRLAPMERL